MPRLNVAASACLALTCSTTLMLGAAFLSIPSARADELAATEGDWPNWRGPGGRGIAPTSADPPTTWSETEHVAWSTEIPGTGHGSIIVVGEDVVVATADLEAQVQSLICLDRETGSIRWNCPVHEGGLKQEGNSKASLASSTPAWDGERYFINFLNNGAIHTTAVSPTGEIEWQQKISDYVVHQGYGSSPTIYHDLVIVGADNKGGGAFAALRRATGEVVWRFERPSKPNYSSPIVWHLAGQDQLILIGCDEVVSLDPARGDVLWRTEGATTECVTTPVTDGRHIFTSGGYPRNHVSAIVADGSNDVTWETDTRVYVPSMIVSDGLLLAAADAGVAYCWEAATGKELWKKRLGGTFSGSPVLVGDLMFVTNEEAETYVVRVSAEGAEIISVNRLGESAFATPTIVGDSVYLRARGGEGDARVDRIHRVRD